MVGYEQYTVGEWTVMRIKDNYFPGNEIMDLADVFQNILDHGASRVAIRFPSGTYPYSRTISFLVRCVKQAKPGSVPLAIITPDKKFSDVLSSCGLLEKLSIYPSETMLPDSTG